MRERLQFAAAAIVAVLIFAVACGLTEALARTIRATGAIA